jgi:hypothetical protein
MDWARTIATNQAALARIVTGLIALVGLVSEGVVARLSRPTYHAVLQVLRPAEAAVRRLIVMAARGQMVKLPPPRPMPAGLALPGKGSGRMSFQLFDARKRFAPRHPRSALARAAPRVHVLFDSSPLVPLFQHRPIERPVPERDGAVDPSRLVRRLAAVKLALEDLPRQARRLARWRARRDRMKSAKFTSPLRPGPPPGHRKEPKDEIDWVLRKCHALARDVLSEDTS